MDLKDKILETIRNEASTGAAIYFSTACMQLHKTPEDITIDDLPKLADILQKKFSQFINPEVGSKIAEKIRILL